MKEAKKTPMKVWIQIAVGLCFMFLFPLLPPIEPITPIGMKIVGIFIGLVYLWSAVDLIWPSMLALLLMAFSGYTGDVTGYAAMKLVLKEAFGNNTMVSLMFAMILFGGVSYVGCTKYFIRFLMTRKFINRRPYMIIFMLIFTTFLLSGLTHVIAALLIMWPVGVELMDRIGYKKGDKVYTAIILGTMIGTTLGQPLFPFKGAAMSVVSAYEKMAGETVNVLSYVLVATVVAVIMIALYVLWIRFVYRPDVELLRNVTVEEFEREDLPPMNKRQKGFMYAVAGYIILMLIPCILPKSLAIVKLINSLNSEGLNFVFIVILMILRDEGEPLMDFKNIAKQTMNWNTYLLVAAALYVAGSLTAEVTGVKPFLVNILQPILGNRPDLLFVLLILMFALITTNFANNAGMGVALLPIITTFADQYPGVSATALSVTMTLTVFVAILTPAASPHAGMLFGRPDIDKKDIMVLGLPFCVMGLIVYTFIGFPIANMLF